MNVAYMFLTSQAPFIIKPIKGGLEHKRARDASWKVPYRIGTIECNKCARMRISSRRRRLFYHFVFSAIDRLILYMLTFSAWLNVFLFCLAFSFDVFRSPVPFGHWNWNRNNNKNMDGIVCMTCRYCCYYCANANVRVSEYKITRIVTWKGNDIQVMGSIWL